MIISLARHSTIVSFAPLQQRVIRDQPRGPFHPSQSHQLPRQLDTNMPGTYNLHFCQ